jgi:phage gpG-like protein
MQIEIALTAEGQRAMAGIAAFPDRLLPAIARGVDMGLELALGQTIARRFTGKGPFPVSDKRLGVVSGRLRMSLRRSPAQVQGDVVRAAIGTNVKYFGVHEFGFEGSVQVKAHNRTRTKAGEPVRDARGRLKKTRIETTHPVKAHSRRMKVPAREPLRTGLKDQRRAIGERISAAMVEEWRRGA